MKPAETNRGSSSMIEVQDLTKRYGHVVANDSISFSVGNGEIVGLLGPNGAGKTTVMRILTGCLPATSGTASVGGYGLSTHATAAKRQIGYLPEFVPLYPDMTVPEYLNFLGALRDLRGRALRAAREGVIERCGLSDMRRRHPPQDIVDQLKSIPGVIGIYSDSDWGQGRPGGPGERRWIVECELGKDLAEEIARRAVQRAWGLAELTPLSLSLEEVFLNLTNSDTVEASS